MNQPKKKQIREGFEKWKVLFTVTRRRKMPKVRDLICILNADFNLDDTIAYSLWTENDVEKLVEQENRNRRLKDDPEVYLEHEDIDDILELMHDENDPDQGLNNDSLYSVYLEISGNLQVEKEEDVSIF